MSGYFMGKMRRKLSKAELAQRRAQWDALLKAVLEKKQKEQQEKEQQGESHDRTETDVQS